MTDRLSTHEWERRCKASLRRSAMRRAFDPSPKLVSWSSAALALILAGAFTGAVLALLYGVGVLGP